MSRCFDRAAARANAAGSDELVDELIEVFREECPAMMDRIHAALAAGEARALQTAAHTLKGAARVLGAEPVAGIAQQFEQYGRDGDLASAGAKVDTLQREVDRLLAALNEPPDSPG